VFWNRRVRIGVVVVSSLLFGVGFGLNAATSNQLVYLLRSVALLHPELFTRDLALSSFDFHHLYSLLCALILRVDASGWLIAVANVAAACFGAWCVYRLLRLFLDEPEAFPAFMLVLTWAGVSNTVAVGGSYVFADIFQPSTLGSVGLLGASLAFVLDRPLATGLWLAFAGAFHSNYLLLTPCVFGVAWLLCGGQQMLRRGLLIFGPSLPILLFHVPFFLASSAAAPAVLERVRHLFMDVRSPHHYLVKPADFAPWLGFQLLAAAALFEPARRGAVTERRLLRLLIGFWALIVPAGVLSSLFGLRFFMQLFAWRISPHAALLAQVALAACIVRSVCNNGLSWRELSRAERGLSVLGIALLLLGALLNKSRDLSLLGVSFALLPLLVGWLRESVSLTGGRWLGILNPLFCITFLAGDFGHLRGVYAKSDLLGGRDLDVMAVCSWVKRNTAVDALLLIPPVEEQIRFQCQRAVVVDWKGAGVLPNDVIEWDRRLEDVTDRHPFEKESQLDGYESLDRDRLERLRQSYHFDLLLVHRDAKLSLGVEPDFAQGRFAAYRMPRP